VNNLSYNEDDILASASGDCAVRLWTSDGQFFASLNIHTMRVTHIRLSDGWEPQACLPHCLQNIAMSGTPEDWELKPQF